MLLLTEARESVEELQAEELDVVAFVSEKAVYQYYEDDGISTKENGTITTITVTADGEINNTAEGQKRIRQAVIVKEADKES